MPYPWQGNSFSNIIANSYVSYPIRYCIHAVSHGKAIATITAITEREEEGTVVFLSFVWCPLDNILFIAPDIQYRTDCGIITNSRTRPACSSSSMIHYSSLSTYTCIIDHWPTYQSIIFVSSYVPNTILYNNQQQQEKEKGDGKESYYLLYCSHRCTIQYISNCRIIQQTIYIHNKKATWVVLTNCTNMYIHTCIWQSTISTTTNTWTATVLDLVVIILWR